MAEALLQKELELTKDHLAETKVVVEKVMFENQCWAAALGRRDAKLEVATARLQDLDEKAEAAATARRQFWEKRKWKDNDERERSCQKK